MRRAAVLKRRASRSKEQRRTQDAVERVAEEQASRMRPKRHVHPVARLSLSRPRRRRCCCVVRSQARSKRPSGAEHERGRTDLVVAVVDGRAETRGTVSLYLCVCSLECAAATLSIHWNSSQECGERD